MPQEPKNLDISSLENCERPKKSQTSKTYNLILDVELELSAILGETKMSLTEILDLTKGSVIELENFLKHILQKGRVPNSRGNGRHSFALCARV